MRIARVSCYLWILQKHFGPNSYRKPNHEIWDQCTFSRTSYSTEDRLSKSAVAWEYYVMRAVPNLLLLIPEVVSCHFAVNTPQTYPFRSWDVTFGMWLGNGFMDMELESLHGQEVCLSIHQTAKTCSGAQPASVGTAFHSGWWSGCGLKQTNHPDLESRLRISGAILHLSSPYKRQ